MTKKDIAARYEVGLLDAAPELMQGCVQDLG